jgi:hypothetical protein
MSLPVNAVLLSILKAKSKICSDAENLFQKIRTSSTVEGSLEWHVPTCTLRDFTLRSAFRSVSLMSVPHSTGSRLGKSSQEGNLTSKLPSTEPHHCHNIWYWLSRRQSPEAPSETAEVHDIIHGKKEYFVWHFSIWCLETRFIYGDPSAFRTGVESWGIHHSEGVKNLMVVLRQ